VTETRPAPRDLWVEEFVVTWINRFSFFLAHHLTRPVLPLYLLTFGASSTVIGAVIAVFTITATLMRIPGNVHGGSRRSAGRVVVLLEPELSHVH
jgi:uncharacterized membrane protein YvlD (DUF360 family)